MSRSWSALQRPFSPVRKRVGNSRRVVLQSICIHSWFSEYVSSEIDQTIGIDRCDKFDLENGGQVVFFGCCFFWNIEC
jgi:hypothetical protein